MHVTRTQQILCSSSISSVFCCCRLFSMRTTFWCPPSFPQWNNKTTSSSRGSITTVETALIRRRTKDKWSEQGEVSVWNAAKMIGSVCCYNNLSTIWQNVKCCILFWNMFVTSDKQPALGWFSSTRDLTHVESFMRLIDMGNRHVASKAGPNEHAVLIEDSWEIIGWWFDSAVQGCRFSLRYRKNGSFQDHSDSLTRFDR